MQRGVDPALGFSDIQSAPAWQAIQLGRHSAKAQLYIGEKFGQSKKRCAKVKLTQKHNATKAKRGKGKAWQRKFSLASLSSTWLRAPSSAAAAAFCIACTAGAPRATPSRRLRLNLSRPWPRQVSSWSCARANQKQNKKQKTNIYIYMYAGTRLMHYLKSAKAKFS